MGLTNAALAPAGSGSRFCEQHTRTVIHADSRGKQTQYRDYLRKVNGHGVRNVTAIGPITARTYRIPTYTPIYTSIRPSVRSTTSRRPSLSVARGYSLSRSLAVYSRLLRSVGRSARSTTDAAAFLGCNERPAGHLPTPHTYLAYVGGDLRQRPIVIIVTDRRTGGRRAGGRRTGGRRAGDRRRRHRRRLVVQV